jgi:hypothetical protein
MSFFGASIDISYIIAPLIIIIMDHYYLAAANDVDEQQRQDSLSRCNNMINRLSISQHTTDINIRVMNGFMNRINSQWQCFDGSQSPDAMLELHIQRHRERDENGNPRFFFIYNCTVWITATYYTYLDRGLATNDEWSIYYLIHLDNQTHVHFYHDNNWFTFKTLL